MLQHGDDMDSDEIQSQEKHLLGTDVFQMGAMRAVEKIERLLVSGCILCAESRKSFRPNLRAKAEAVSVQSWNGPPYGCGHQYCGQRS
jgi:hypothetical protein